MVLLWDKGRPLTSDRSGDQMSCFRREVGQGLIEYALLALLIALAALVAITVFGQAVSGLYSQILSRWPS